MQTLELNKVDNSKIKEFKTCPRKFFYSHVLGWKSQQPNNHLVFGSAWHEAQEHLLLYGYSQVEVLNAYDKFLTYYRTYFGPETDDFFPSKNPDKAFERLAQYTAYPEYRQDLEFFETLHTEIAGSVMIDEKRQMYFRMDAVLKNKHNGKIRSREHKTGSGSYLWAEQWLLDGQVGTYNHVLNCLYPQDSVDGVEMNGSFFPKNRKSPAEPKNVFSRFLIKRTNEQMQTWIDNTRFYLWELEREYSLLNDAKESDQTLHAFPLRDTSCLNYFRLCEYHDFCMAWANPLRNAYQPPLGFKEEFWDPTAKPAKEIFNLEVKEY